MDEEWAAYRCTTATFVPHRRHDVRWLDPEADRALLDGVWSVPLTDADLARWSAEGTCYAGVVEDGVIVSIAARFAWAEESWELGAVRTKEAHRGRGLARSACTFVTAHILGAGKVATCHTLATNVAMRRVVESLGFTRIAG